MRASASIALAMALVSAPLAAKPSASAPPSGVAGAIAAIDRTPDNVKLDEGPQAAAAAEVPRPQVRHEGARSVRRQSLLGGNHGPSGRAEGSCDGLAADAVLRHERRQGFDEIRGAAEPERASDRHARSKRQTFLRTAYDFVIINLNYHDVYWERREVRKIVRMDPDAWLKTVYAAMKPGAVVGVIDHVAIAGRRHPGDGREISPDRPGSRESGLRARPASSWRPAATSCATRPTIIACSSSIPHIRGKTDRFIFKFKKPS